MVTLTAFKKNGEWFDTLHVEFVYESRKDLIKQIKAFKKMNYANYNLCLIEEDGNKTMQHLFL